MSIDKETVFDLIKKGQCLFLEERFFESYHLLRENINRSEVTNDDIWDILKGEISLHWEPNDVFNIIEKQDVYQASLVSNLVENYKNLIAIENKYFYVCKEVDYDFFEMISPRKFQKDVLHSVGQLKAFMMDISGDYFIIKENKLLFINEKEIERNNPFL